MPGDPSLIPGLGRTAGKGIDYPLQDSSASLVAQLVKNPPAIQMTWVDPWVGKIPWRREWPATSVFWPGEFWPVTKSWTQLSNFHFHFTPILTDMTWPIGDKASWDSSLLHFSLRFPVPYICSLCFPCLLAYCVALYYPVASWEIVTGNWQVMKGCGYEPCATSEFVTSGGEEFGRRPEMSLNNLKLFV